MTIKIEGMDRVVLQLAKLKRGEWIGRALPRMAVHVKSKLAPYAPATEANSPSMRRWYQRGFGPRWRRRDGSIGGRKTSESLKHKWNIKIQRGGRRVVLENKASYSGYVHGPRQAAFHRKRGWKEGADVLREEENILNGIAAQELRKDLGQ